ncbi:hypothetical protein [Polaromonas sp.]|uniref:hypothetical protein n=1 Tax=Polaromonas sp. TaxID=1869339 RepID=UPI0032678101
MPNGFQHVLLLDTKKNRSNAGPKARLDTAHFLRESGFAVQQVPTSRSKYWRRLIAFFLSHARLRFQPTDVLWCQFPPELPTRAVLEKAQRRNIPTVAFVHDLEGLRSDPPRPDLIEKEARELQRFTHVLSLNDTVSELLQRHGLKPTAALNCWDYFCPAWQDPSPTPSPIPSATSAAPRPQFLPPRLVYAGNLSPGKSGFIYRLGEVPGLSFELYGAGLEEGFGEQANIRYRGTFSPDHPPFQADGAFGLVWDGATLDTCSGDYGAYLQFNTPHKASLYLSQGLPVVVWHQACIAPLIAAHGAGILVSSLHELEAVFARLSQAEYEKMCEGAGQLGQKIRGGHFIKTAAAKIQAAFV